MRTDPETRQCQNCRNSFEIEAQDFAFYEKMKVPPPTWCPQCRMMRRFLFRSEHYLNRRPDSLDGKEIFSGVPTQSPYKVYDHDYWWSDSWSALDYGREYDFTRPFFEQFKKLAEDVPWCAKTVQNMTNSDYCDQASYCKNVYLSFDIDYLENCAYLVNGGKTKDSYDLLSCIGDELCYEGIMVNSSYRTLFSENCEDCRNSWFLKNCVGCSDCLGCVNLKNKSYHIFNQPYSKEEYRQKLKEFDLGSSPNLQKFAREAEEFARKFPVKDLHGLRNVRSSGDYLNDTKNVRDSFIVHNAENSRFIQLVFYKTTDSYDYTVWGDSASQMYECLTCGQQVDSLKFCFDCWPACQNLEYCMSCRSSQNLFGCFGLRNKQYCIFNKQYSKEDYFELREKIVQQMQEVPYTDKRGRVYKYGEFFPSEFSAFSYNQTVAQDLFPLTKEEAEKRGFLWREPDSREYKTTISSSAVPDRIEDVQDGILNEIIQCEKCKKAYRIIPPELNFYKQIGLPLPRKCPDCRLARRFALLNQPVLAIRNCACAGRSDKSGIYENTAEHFHGDKECPGTFETAYAENRPEIVYCEQCYNAEVA